MYSNPFDQGLDDLTIYDDPYPIYQTLRKTMPVSWSTLKNTWVVTKYKDIKDAMNKSCLTAKRHSIQIDGLPSDLQRSLENFYYGWLMYQEDPAHSRIKRVAHKLFSRQFIDKIQKSTQKVAFDSLTHCQDGKYLDVIGDFGYHLGLYSVCELVGVPSENFSQIANWAHIIVDFMQGRNQDLSHAANRARTAINELTEFLVMLFDKQRTIPTAPLYEILNDDSLSEEDCLGLVSNILMDGYEPITNAIANSILALYKNPEQLSLLREDMNLLNTGIDELLRYDPPFQYIVRIVSKDLVIGNSKIVAGERILLMIGSANRDPSIFRNPEKLDLGRSENLHRTFGFDHHYCVGAYLGKAILKTALECFLRTINQFEVIRDPLPRYHSLGSRALRILPIRWS